MVGAIGDVSFFTFTVTGGLEEHSLKSLFENIIKNNRLK